MKLKIDTRSCDMIIDMLDMHATEHSEALALIKAARAQHGLNIAKWPAETVQAGSRIMDQIERLMTDGVDVELMLNDWKKGRGK